MKQIPNLSTPHLSSSQLSMHSFSSRPRSRYRFRRAARLLAAGVVALGLSAAQAEEKKDDAPEWPERLSEYERTGEYKDCLGVTEMRSSRIIDKQHILFTTRGGDTYVNQLPRKCYSLRRYGGFSYSTSLPKLCHLEIITAIDSDGIEYGTCGIGKFERVVEKPVDADQKTN